MKLLENPAFYALASALSDDCNSCRLEVRLESYSCKLVVNEKRIWKEIASESQQLEALSPPQSEEIWMHRNGSPRQQQQQHLSRSLSSDPDDDDKDGDVIICDSINRKTLFYLTSTLNSCFPDYEFTNARGEAFCRERSLDKVVSAVNHKLGLVIASYGNVRTALWQAIDKEIQLAGSAIYSYVPDMQSGSDPFAADGVLWSFNYCLYNKKLKRVVFFACRALSKQADFLPDEIQTQWSMDDEEMG